MRRLNNRGFTMVELLATIVIIGILGTVGVVGVTKSIKSAKDRYYVAQNKLFISAAQTYFTDNKSRIPMKSGTNKKVTLKTLNDENYIEKIVDYNKKEYNKDSFVTVTKLGLNMYSYEGNLILSNGQVQDYKEPGESDASVKFTVDKKDFSMNSDTKYTNGNKSVAISIKDTDGIAGYIISITKRNKTVNEMDYIEAGGSTTASNQITISTDKYGDGEYRVKVKVYDKYNDQISYTSGKIVVDTIAPKCRIDLDGEKEKGNSWYNKRSVNVKLNIEEINRDRYDFSNQALTSPKYEKKDTGKSAAMIKVDNIEQDDTDKNGITYHAYVVDKAGNTEECTSGNFKVDKTSPSCTIKVTNNLDGKNGWYISPANIQMTEEGDGEIGSGVVERGIGTSPSPNYGGNQIAQQGNTTGVTWYGFVKDEAGNTGRCKTTDEVRVDTTNPYWVTDCRGNDDCQGNGITSKHNNAWTNESFRMGQYFEGSTSEVASIHRFECSACDESSCRKLDDATYDGSDSFTKRYRQTNEYSEGQNRIIGFKVENKAGRMSAMACVTIKIDKTAPKVWITLGSNGKHTGHCKDNIDNAPTISGIKEFKLYGEEGKKDDHYGLAGGTSSKIITSWTTNADKSPTYRCEDNAGNVTTFSEGFTCKCYDVNPEPTEEVKCHKENVRPNGKISCSRPS